MIKLIYIILIPVCCVLIIILFTLHLTYRKPVVNEEMGRISETLIRNKPSFSSLNPQSMTPEIQFSDMGENDIFDSSRGNVAASVSGAPKDVDVIGIFNNDDGTLGAIILIGNQSYGNQGRYSQYGNQSQSDSAQNTKNVFLLGEKLPNGYVLKSISSNSIELQSDDQVFKVDINYTDDKSQKRIAENQKDNTKEQIKIIETNNSQDMGKSNSN